MGTLDLITYVYCYMTQVAFTAHVVAGVAPSWAVSVADEGGQTISKPSFHELLKE
jgi:hypothetical protein